MGTHAMVGYWDASTGKVTASYIHYDGYFEGVGDTLIKHYNDDDSANLVATGGYLSSLEEGYDESWDKSVHHDPAIEYESVKHFMKSGADWVGAQYLYLWDGATWFGAAAREKFTDVETLLVGVDIRPESV